MDYRTGSYIIHGRKDHKCKMCKIIIHVNLPHFTRVEEHGQIFTKQDGSTFKQKKYHRYHMECARRLKNLNTYEHTLLNK